MFAQNFHKYFENQILICCFGLAGYGESNAIQTRKLLKFLCLRGFSQWRKSGQWTYGTACLISIAAPSGEFGFRAFGKLV